MKPATIAAVLFTLALGHLPSAVSAEESGLPNQSSGQEPEVPATIPLRAQNLFHPTANRRQNLRRSSRKMRNARQKSSRNARRDRMPKHVGNIM